MTSDSGTAVPPAASGPAGAEVDSTAAPGSEALALDALMEVSMPVIIEIGRTTLALSEILELREGSLVQLDRMVGEPVDVHISDQKLAEGEVVVIGDNFGVRITRVLGTPGEKRA